MRGLVQVIVASLLLAGCVSPSAQSLVVVSVDADAPITDIATLHGNVPLHSTGSSWTPMSGNAPQSCAPVWGADGTHLWFGCAGGLYAFDGTTWASPVLTTIQVVGLYGTSAHDVYAVGNDGSGNGVIYHYF